MPPDIHCVFLGGRSCWVFRRGSFEFWDKKSARIPKFHCKPVTGQFILTQVLCNPKGKRGVEGCHGLLPPMFASCFPQASSRQTGFLCAMIEAVKTRNFRAAAKAKGDRIG